MVLSKTLMHGAAMRRLALLSLTTAGLFWGLGFPLGKLALKEVLPAHMVLLRFLIAGIASLPFALGSSEARSLFRSPPVLWAGVFYGIAFLIQFEGLAGVTVTLAALLVGAMPALVAIAAYLMGETVTRTSWLGVIAATVGAVLIAGKPGSAGTALGISLSLLSLVVFLAWLLVSRRAPNTRSALAVPTVMLIVAAATVTPLALALHGLPPINLSTSAWSGIVGQGLLSTFAATAAWQYGAARVDSATAGVFINIEPLVGALIGITLFHDPVGMPVLVGGLAIVIGSIVVVRGERGSAPAAAAAANHGLSLD